MKPPTQRSPLLVWASGGSVLAVAALVPVASAQADTAAQLEIGSTLRATELTALTVPGQATETLAAQEEKAKKKRQAQKSKYRTGDLPGNKAVPLQNFRVGPLYGNRGPHTGGVHGGLDMGARTGEPIYAVAPGKVSFAGWQGAAGKSVTIAVKGGKYVLYGHMSAINAKVGQQVKAGEKIGEVGSTGNSTGPHLHLQVERPGQGTMDPLPWLGVSATELARFGRK